MTTEEVVKKRGKIFQTRTPLSLEIKKSINMLFFTLLAIIVLVSIVYLLNSSQSNQKGYSIKQQQLEKDTLLEQSRELVQKIIQAQSFKNIENDQLVKSMIKPESPIYIDTDKNK